MTSTRQLWTLLTLLLVVSFGVLLLVGRDDPVGVAIAEFGGVDVLHNNAGIVIYGTVVDMPEEDWDRVIAVNLKAGMFLGQAVARRQVQAGQPGRHVH